MDVCAKIEGNAPRISVNKLGEYLTASPVRRRRIIRDQREPRPFVVNRYRQARKAIRAYLKTGGAQPELIAEMAELLEAAEPESNFAAQDARCSAEALEAFMELAEALALDDVYIERPSGPYPYLSVAGVGVSIRPDLILRGVDGRGRPFAGAIKIHIAKTHPLSEEAGAYVATLLRRYLCQTESVGVSPAHCMVLDVFSHRIHRAPRAFRRRMGAIEAACEEIGQRWGHV